MTWVIETGPEPLGEHQDHLRFHFELGRGDERRKVIVDLTGTVMASEPSTLPSPLDEAVRTEGRSSVEERLRRREPPARIIVSSTGETVVPQEGAYEQGDRVFVRDEAEEAWTEATYLGAGEPSNAVAVEDARVEGGGYMRDVAFVRRNDRDVPEAYRYERIRATPPR